MMKEFLNSSYLFGGNAPFIEDLYEKYLANPQSVPEEWREYFDRMQVLPGAVPVSTLFAPPTDPPTVFVTLEGDVLTVDLATLTVNGAHVDPVAPEVTTPAGVLHVTDKAVVVPPQIAPAEPVPPTTVASG